MVVIKQEKSLGEPDAHWMTRKARVVLRLMLLIAVVATILLMIFYRPAAYLAALPVPALLLAYSYVSHLERQSRADVLRNPRQKSISQDEVELDVQYAGIFTALALFILIALSTFMIAATMIEDWSMVGLAAAVLFLLAILIMLPYLPLFIIDSSTDERDKLMSESTTASPPPGNKEEADRH
jgi:hypothetical protein